MCTTCNSSWKGTSVRYQWSERQNSRQQTRKNYKQITVREWKNTKTIRKLEWVGSLQRIQKTSLHKNVNSLYRFVFPSILYIVLKKCVTNPKWRFLTSLIETFSYRHSSFFYSLSTNYMAAVKNRKLALLDSFRTWSLRALAGFVIWQEHASSRHVMTLMVVNAEVDDNCSGGRPGIIE